jgi:hypothetical protein
MPAAGAAAAGGGYLGVYFRNDRACELWELSYLGADTLGAARQNEPADEYAF